MNCLIIANKNGAILDLVNPIEIKCNEVYNTASDFIQGKTTYLYYTLNRAKFEDIFGYVSILNDGGVDTVANPKGKFDNIILVGATKKIYEKILPACKSVKVIVDNQSVKIPKRDEEMFPDLRLMKEDCDFEVVEFQ